jgi:hypothetical protein
MLYREPRMTRLDRQLAGCGFAGDAEAFRITLVELLVGLFPGCTDEDVLCEPINKAIPYCEAVRAKFDCSFPDRLILKTLLNTRKASCRPKTGE